ncbi:ABC transporter substrate-binding protein [Youhaiella tibetensis]|uniref:TRAP transporter substrate-binding protein n=1 Tax=Paradevosia tibetensis TaxID=1447062 RepID=A0A5B9DRI1_9HYPH|nr:TRAP transporter substrate-binding protein [Youhaiella tibetensis]QEE21827.1 TRAP transporter substrate-binding protein [Youhaiella tibetensis]GGF47922.1 ABC transporter substrate-binding protein [Youhaiella tibetensis]
MKSILKSALVASAFILAGANFSAAQEIKVGLSLAQNASGFDFVNGMYETFKAEVEANSDMTVDLVYAGALGAPNERLNQMRRGVIQMTDAADGNYATIHRDVQILNMPYLFSSEKAAWTVFDGPFGQALAEDVRKKTGIRVLGWWESGGFKHFSATRPIKGPEDMKGLKVRVLGPLATIPVEALGASPAPIAFSELYTSLKTGVVDGQDNSVSVFNLVKLYEVQPNLTLTGHTYAFGPLGINDAFFAGLDEAKQKVITDAATKAIAFNRAKSREVEAAAISFAKDHGVTMVELDASAKEAFRDIMQPAAIAWLKDNVDTLELIDQAIAAAKAAE